MAAGIILPIYFIGVLENKTEKREGKGTR